MATGVGALRIGLGLALLGSRLGANRVVTFGGGSVGLARDVLDRDSPNLAVMRSTAATVLAILAFGNVTCHGAPQPIRRDEVVD